MMFVRPLVQTLREGLEIAPDLLQLLVGPRQVGKTTAAHQLMKRWDGPTRYASADELRPPDASWIAVQWDLARRSSGCLLVLDEVQKVPGWSEAVKAEFDRDRRTGADVRVLLLGSSALLLARGASESLAGRFLVHRCLHWSWPECRSAFGWDLDQWLYFGGYPGAARFAGDEVFWRRYVRDALVEPALGRDVLALHAIAKPALLRQLFGLAVSMPAHVLSINKMLGQLQDAGNAATVAHYLDVLAAAFLVSGLQKHAFSAVRKKASAPKLLVWSNALVTANDPRSLEAVRADSRRWGRLVENAVGAHLLSGLAGPPWDLWWWRDGDLEVDFVAPTPTGYLAVEVKSGRPRRTPGLTAFLAKYPDARPLIVGSGGVSLEEFFETPAATWLGATPSSTA